MTTLEYSEQLRELLKRLVSEHGLEAASHLVEDLLAGGLGAVAPGPGVEETRFDAYEIWRTRIQAPRERDKT